MKKLALFGFLAVLGTAGSARAWSLACRFVERVGTSDVVLGGGDTMDGSNGQPRRVRIQFGIFDDADGPAPVGGFAGWNSGTIVVSGPSNNSDETRTPGRLTPFDSVVDDGQNHPNGNPPLPSGDPFDLLTDIDATLGPQSPPWVCDAEGNVPPRPEARVRGRYTFVSVYELTINPSNSDLINYTVTFSGNAFGASAWQTVGNPIPPDCGDPANPFDDIAGSVTYSPNRTDPRAFSCVLNVLVPAPSTLTLLILGAFYVPRRQRSCSLHGR